MLVLFIKLLLVPLLLATVTWANGKVGPRWAGALAALPIVAGPAALAVTLEQGAAFGAQAAAATLVGEASLGTFCVVYLRLCRTHGWGMSLLAGWLAFGASALAFSACNIGFQAALMLALVTPFGIARLAPHPEGPARGATVRASEFVLRMLAGAALVSVISSAAHLLGSTWSGLLTIFPIATSVLAASAQRSGGPDQTLHLLRGLGAGLYSLTAFFATLATGLARWGIAGAFLAALAAAIGVQALVLGALAHASARAV